MWLRPVVYLQLSEMEGMEALVSAKRTKIRELVQEAFVSKAPLHAPLTWETKAEGLRDFVHKLVDAVSALSAAVRTDMF